MGLPEEHRRTVLTEFDAYSNHDRPHRALHLEVPVPGAGVGGAATGAIRARPVFGGLHHVYERVA